MNTSDFILKQKFKQHTKKTNETKVAWSEKE